MEMEIGARFADGIPGDAEAKTLEAKYLGVAGPVVPTYSTEVRAADLEFYASVGREIGALRQSVDADKLIWK